MNELPRGMEYEDLPGAGDVAAAELATSLRTGRHLEAYAAAEHAEPGPDFVGRVMEAIAAEPDPQPAAAARRAVLAARPLAVLASVRDAWRVAFGGGRPAFARAQAMAVVLVAVVALAGIGGATVGALALLDRGGPTPTPTEPLPSPSPPPALSPTPSPVSTPSAPPRVSPTPTPTETVEPTETTEPTETPEGTDDDNSGPGGGGDSVRDDPSPTGDDSGRGSSGSSGPGSGHDGAAG